MTDNELAVIILLIVFALYLIKSIHTYLLAFRIGDKNAWVSFIPGFQIYVYFLLLREARGSRSIAKYMLLFFVVGSMIKIFGYSSLILSPFVLLGHRIFIMWVLGHNIERYSPRSPSALYMVLVFFFGFYGMLLWSLRHKEEIGDIYKYKSVQNRSSYRDDRAYGSGSARSRKTSDAELHVKPAKKEVLDAEVTEKQQVFSYRETVKDFNHLHYNDKPISRNVTDYNKLD